MLVEGNMLSKDAVAAMREKHPNYMPYLTVILMKRVWVKEKAL